MTRHCTKGRVCHRGQRVGNSVSAVRLGEGGGGEGQQEVSGTVGKITHEQQKAFKTKH